MNAPRSSRHRLTELYASRHEPEYMRVFAELLWRTLLTFFAIGVLVALLFAANTFWNVMRELGSASGGALKQSAILDRAQLQGTLRLIEERRAAFEAKKNSPAPVVDPSK